MDVPRSGVRFTWLLWCQIYLTTVVSDLLDYCGVGHRCQLLDMGDTYLHKYESFWGKFWHAHTWIYVVNSYYYRSLLNVRYYVGALWSGFWLVMLATKFAQCLLCCFVQWLEYMIDGTTCDHSKCCVVWDNFAAALLPAPSQGLPAFNLSVQPLPTCSSLCTITQYF